MFKKALALIMIVTGAGMVGLLDPSPVHATGHSATRSFSADTVEPGDELVVTIEAADFGRGAYIEETLPEGFTFVSSDHPDGQADGQKVNVLLFALEGPFIYTVTASATAGDYDFDGFIRDFERDVRDVGGATTVTVEAGAVTPSPSPSPTQPPADGGPSATRSFSDSTVESGGEVVVSIEAADYGAGAVVFETLPAGFSYVSGSLPYTGVTPLAGGQIAFTLLDDSFTYTVTAPGVAGDYDFNGFIRDFDRVEAPVGGDSRITVEARAASSASAIRSFSDSTVEPGDEVVVSIDAANYGIGGAVIETLPAGFTYVSSSLSEPRAVTLIDDRRVGFTLLDDGAGSFTYTVTASDAAGEYDFSGIIRDFDADEAAVGGDSTVTVAVPVTPTPTSTPVTPTASPTAVPSPTTGISVTTARVPALTAGGSSSRVNLPSIFSDMETDGLTYTAISSRSSVVRARVSGVILRLTPGGAGTARITVTATDDDGNKTRRTFTVRVRAAELPPVGDLTAPNWLLALLALAGAALVPAGVLTLRSRRRRAAP